VFELGAGDELHHAEATRVVEGNARARRHVEHDVVVGGVLGALVVVAARHALAAPGRDAKRPRHAEMHHQHVAGRQVRKQIFGAPSEALDRLAFEPGGEILRQRPAQVAAVRDDLGEARALHHRRESAAHRFDFGQFGHG
jgi:hypothetical protein